MTQLADVQGSAQPGQAHDLAVVGLGYVGLPLASEAVGSGMKVVGYDVSRAVVDGLRSSRSHVDDVDDDTLRAMFEQGFTVTTDAASLANAHVITICVPTPLDASGLPDLTAVRAAGRAVGANLTPGTLVVLESTTYPGSTEADLVPLLEASGLRAGQDFSVAFSPERVDPGNTVWDVRSTPKVVGGLSPACTDRAVAFYERLVDTVVRARGIREAELAKLLENTYRHINIALVNEIAGVADALGVDVVDAIECASTKPFGFHAFYPSAGAGGHCIPVDPGYLAFAARAQGRRLQLVELASHINDAMPGEVVDRAVRLLNDSGRPMRGAEVLVLGVAYKPDVSDDRESPAFGVVEHLQRLGARFSYHDPNVPAWRDHSGRQHTSAPDLDAAVARADLVVLLQRHRQYDDELLGRAQVLLDPSRRLR